MLYKLLNPETLEEDENGERYQVQTLGGAVIIAACPSAEEPPIILDPIVDPLQEIKDNQLTLMNAIADVYILMAVGGV